MPTKITVSFPSADLARSTAFYTAIGATVNATFSDDRVACFEWDENLQFMLLDREFFATFTSKQIANPAQSAQVQIALSSATRADVDRVVDAGVNAGGSEPEPAQDHGFMYTRDLEDPDGNNLAFMYVTADEPG